MIGSRISQTKVIQTTMDLSAALGDDFVLFVGSAISGVSCPHLAMVSQVVTGITESLSRKFPENSYVQQLYARYVDALVNGSYSNLLDGTKFEEFLWLVTRASNRAALNNLLNGLYTCGKDEFGPNHQAIAALLRSGRCCACFTTNFDNAIEQACPELMVYDDLGKYPVRLPHKGERPVLIKLHGSAPKGNCVAESIEILFALSEKSHGAVQNLLSARKVLVLGYSGLGDIDISPHLSNTDATFFWANHKYTDQMPDWVNYFVLSNLLSMPDSGPPNLLLELAGTNISPKAVCRARQSPATILKEWVERTDLDAGTLIRSLFEWRRAWPVLHLYHEEPVAGSIVARCRMYGWACIQMRAYKTALKAFSSIPGGEPMTIEDEFHTQQGRGFALWRLGRLEEAREVLERLAEKALKDFDTGAISANQQLAALLSGVCRNYLEVSRDLMQWFPPKRRLQATREWKLEQVFELLESLPKGSLGGWLLNRLVILHIKWLLGEKINIEEIKDLYENSMNSSHFNIASAVVSLILQMSLRDGWKAWRIVHNKLKETGIKHYVRKNYQSLIGVIGATRLGRPIGKTVIRIFGHCRTWMQEREYKAKVNEWSHWRKEWITSGKIITLEE